MLILTGDTRDRHLVALLRAHGWGRMWIDKRPTPWPGEQWGFDNGAFRDWQQGRDFDGEAFLRRLEQAYAVGRPYLAVVPDLVSQGRRSLEFSLRWLEKLPRDWPWYLAVQDGMTLEDVKAELPKFAGIFLGGTDRFKHTAFWWCQLAHQFDKRFHYGRAGTPRKIALAREVGADSVDSAFPLWSRRRLKEFLQICEGRIVQPRLWGLEVVALRPEQVG